jgi:LPXTG-site transpeptidase (sortase) family protein
MAKAGRENKPPFLVFLAASVVFFFLALSAADSIGFVPCSLDGTCTDRSEIQYLPIFENPDTNIRESIPLEMAVPSVTVPPSRIKIGQIGLDLPVQNPATTDLAALDVLLKDGPARHALSGRLGDQRNMIIFAHSSNLPVVHNAMYKAFNRVPELKEGDSIEITGEDGVVHIYLVSSVEKADANTFEENFLATDAKRLILVTCDTLTSKTARFVLRAEYFGVLDRSQQI